MTAVSSCGTYSHTRFSISYTMLCRLPGMFRGHEQRSPNEHRKVSRGLLLLREQRRLIIRPRYMWRVGDVGIDAFGNV